MSDNTPAVTPIRPPDVDAVRRRIENTTPGPWYYNGYAWVANQDRPDIRDGLTFDEWSDKIDNDTGAGHSAERYGACPGCGTDRPQGCVYAKEWTAREPGVCSVPPSYGDTATGRHAADAEFIAHAREDVPALLSYIDALLARTLTPEEAALADALIRVGHPSGLDETDYMLLAKLGQIAGDR